LVMKNRVTLGMDNINAVSDLRHVEASSYADDMLAKHLRCQRLTH